MKDAFPLLHPELQLPLSHLEGKAPLCQQICAVCQSLFAGGFFSVQSETEEGALFFFSLIVLLRCPSQIQML